MSETRNRIDDEDMDTQGGYYLSGLFNIETSPGFKALESVKGRKDVNEEQITRYRTEFIKLHGFLLNLHNHQKGMVEHLRLTLQEITLAKLDQDRAISQQFSGNAEIGELKRELVKAQNEVDMALDLEAKLQLDMEDLLKTKQDLVHDIEEIRRHKADMLEPQLIAATKELKMELVQRRHQIENLQKDLEEKQVVLNGVMLERDRAEAEKEKHSIALAKASETPIKILKQIEVLQDAINALQGEHTKQMTIGSSLDKEIERLGKKKKDLEEHRLNQSAAYEERRGLISQMERQVDDIFKEHEVAKEQLSFQKAERVRLDLGLRKVLHEIKREHDLVLRVIREKDTYLKYFRRLELTVNNIKMSTPSTIKQGEELQRQLKGIKADEGFYRKEIVRLRQAIDISTLEFLKQDKLEKSEVEALEEHRQLNQKLEQELEVALKEAAESAKAAEELKIEKDLKLRDVIRAGSKMRSVKNDNITQDIAVVDAYKRCQETTQRVKEFLTLYELVKNEKNKYVSFVNVVESNPFVDTTSCRNEGKDQDLDQRD
jgi:chromosome segregation ATPase